MAIVGWIIVGGAAVVGMTIVRGLLVRQLWTWFVIPAVAAPPISLVEAIGISMVAALLTSDFADETEPLTRERFVKLVVKALVIYGLAFGFAAIVHAFA